MAKKRKARPAKAVAADTYADDEAEASASEPASTKDKDEDEGDILKEALKRYQAGWEHDRDNKSNAYEDLKFMVDEEGAQWDAKSRQTREDQSRPILTINKCPQFVRQITGDIRQLRPAFRVVPVDDSASEEVASDVMPGMLRYIQERSDAKAAFFAAADQMVAAGIGHVRVYTEYASDTTFDQEIRIGPVEDGIAVVWDPDSTELTRRDAMWCIVPFDYAKATFEENWPDAKPDPLPELSYEAAFTDWNTAEIVRVGEYWRKVPIKRTLALYENGAIVDLTDDEDGTKRADAEAGQARIEKRDGYRVERALITAGSVLEKPAKTAGSHIPIVPFIGEQTKIGRNMHRRGVIRPLRDVQRLYNYAASADAEVVALQPKAPFLGTRKNFEKYEDEWETANILNHPFLQYEPDPANSGAAPSRVQPPVGSDGVQALLLTASNDMSAVTGIYPAALGASSNETSGRAIVARQREGDTGTYLYIDAFTRGVQRCGEIVLDLIPTVYDTERTIRIVGEDGKVDKLELNKQAPNPEFNPMDPNGDGEATVALNDVTIGAYHLTVEMGPSYSTKREEARDGMEGLMRTLGPEAAQLFVDLYAKAQDFPLADKIAKRAEQLLPPHIRAAEAAESGEPPPEVPQVPPPPPTPEQQIEMAQTEQKGQQARLDAEQHQREFMLKEKELEARAAKTAADLEMARMKHEETMAACNQAIAQSQTMVAEHGAKTAELNQKTAETQADPRYEGLVGQISQLQQAITAIADAVGAHIDELGKAPPTPEYMPALQATLDKLASQKRPTGITRTSQGLKLVFDENDSPPGSLPTAVGGTPIPELGQTQ